jgi:hypothetical protein
VRAVGTAGVQRMLDVEGGSGAYSIAFVQAGPELRAEVLDRAELLAIAQGHIDRAGLAGRVTTRAAAWSSRTSSWSLDFGLLEGGQSCPQPAFSRLLQDFILEQDMTAPKMAALFSLNMLVERSAAPVITKVSTRRGSARPFPRRAPHPFAGAERADGGCIG